MKEIMRIWCQNLVQLSPWIGEEMKSKNVDAILVVMMSQPRCHLFIILCLPFIEGSGDRGGLLPQKDICNVVNIRMIIRIIL